MKQFLSQGLFNIKFFLLSVLSNVAIAQQYQPAAGIGKVASNLMEPVGLMSDFIYTACIIIGASFIFASVIKYIEHRRSPLMVPISTPIFLLVAGVFLVAMPFLSFLSSSAIRYSLFR